MTSALDQSGLFALLAAGETVILPGAHAARTLGARFNSHLQQNPHTATDPARALAWHEWTASLWSGLVLDGTEDRLLLNHLQEEQLWAEIIAGHPATRHLPSPDNLAGLARSAMRLAAAYNALDRLRPAADTFDSRTFAAWLDTFRDHCRRHRLLPLALLEQTLLHHLRTGNLRPAGPIHFAGTEEQTPSQRDLVTALQNHGVEVRTHLCVHPERGNSPALLRAPDPQEELRLAVRLIAQEAREGHNRTFAILLPDPASRRLELERLFREILAPELDAITADLSSTPWEFAAPSALSTSTAIGHALALLRWIPEPLSTQRIGQLLLSPYLTFTQDLETLARFEARELHDSRLLRPQFSLGEFLHFAARTTRTPIRFPELKAVLNAVEREKILQRDRSYADWADQIRAVLRAAGWPGPRTLNPAEFRAVQAWDSLLDLLSTLGTTGRRIPFATFLQQLEREAKTATVPTLSPQAPLQILTLTEAEGTAFDLTLLLGATDKNLPVTEPLHPLLPRHLQSRLRMPGTDPAQTYAQTRARLQRLSARSRSLILSAPVADETGPVRLTPLASELGSDASLRGALLSAPGRPDPVPLEEIPDTAPLPVLPHSHVRGGARVLELQAACGFRAFAAFRLAAGEIFSADLGLAHREAGSRLHRALELLWTDLRDQATLRALSPGDREKAARAAVHAALQPLHSTPAASDPWSQAFLRVLETRYTHLLGRWLDCELERSPFTILATEQEKSSTVGPIELTLRIDRIDQVQDGQVFIDYKTAYTLSTEDWLGPRPDAPQLPLYALLANPEDLRGIAFARVRPDKDIGWISLADRPGLFSKTAKKPADDLAALREEWQLELTSLAKAFATGQSDVNPKSYPETCKYCSYRVLCRLDPRNLLAQDADGDLLEDELDG